MPPSPPPQRRHGMLTRLPQSPFRQRTRKAHPRRHRRRTTSDRLTSELPNRILLQGTPRLERRHRRTRTRCPRRYLESISIGAHQIRTGSSPEYLHARRIVACRNQHRRRTQPTGDSRHCPRDSVPPRRSRIAIGTSIREISVHQSRCRHRHTPPVRLPRILPVAGTNPNRLDRSAPSGKSSADSSECSRVEMSRRRSRPSRRHRGSSPLLRDLLTRTASSNQRPRRTSPIFLTATGHLMRHRK